MDKRLKAGSRAIDEAGGTLAVADAFELTPAAVSLWRRRGVPAQHVLRLEEMCQRKVTRHQMAPAVFG